MAGGRHRTRTCTPFEGLTVFKTAAVRPIILNLPVVEIGSPARFRPVNSGLTVRRDTVSLQAILFGKMVGAGGNAPLVSFRNVY